MTSRRSGNTSANGATVLLQAVRAAAGIAMLPTYLAAPLIAGGELAVVLPGHEPEAMGIHGVSTSRRQMPLIVRSFLDFLAARFGEEPEWDRPLRWAAESGRPAKRARLE